MDRKLCWSPKQKALLSLSDLCVATLPPATCLTVLVARDPINQIRKEPYIVALELSEGTSEYSQYLGSGLCFF
jgi:hypothetical protein